jgi:hypothetical protein
MRHTQDEWRTAGLRLKEYLGKPFPSPLEEPPFQRLGDLPVGAAFRAPCGCVGRRRGIVPFTDNNIYTRWTAACGAHRNVRRLPPVFQPAYFVVLPLEDDFIAALCESFPPL